MTFWLLVDLAKGQNLVYIYVSVKYLPTANNLLHMYVFLFNRYNGHFRYSDENSLNVMSCHYLFKEIIYTGTCINTIN